MQAARDLSLSPEKAVAWGTPLSFVLLAAVVIAHRLLYAEDPLKALFRSLTGWGFATVLVAGIIVHEAIHALTWQLAGGLRRGEVRFGVNWRVLMPYAHPIRPLTVRAYAIGAAAPGVLLGLAPALVGLALGVAPISGFGALFTTAAAGDLIVLYLLRGLSASALVQDHPTRVGCELVHPG